MPRQLAPQAALALSFFAAAGSLPAAAQPGPMGYPDPSFEIVNNTDRGIEQLFANPVGLRDWGHDRLGAQWVPPGARHVVRLDPRGGCRQDLRLVWRDGSVQDLRDIDTCAQRQLVLGAPSYAPMPAPMPGKMAPGYAPQPPLTLRLENRGGRPITLAFATPSGQPDWGQDLLLGRMLRAGARQSLALPPGPCLYDIKVVFADGAAQEARGLDLCARPAVRFP